MIEMDGDEETDWWLYLLALVGGVIHWITVI